MSVGPGDGSSLNMIFDFPVRLIDLIYRYHGASARCFGRGEMVAPHGSPKSIEVLKTTPQTMTMNKIK